MWSAPSATYAVESLKDERWGLSWWQKTAGDYHSSRGGV